MDETDIYKATREHAVSNSIHGYNHEIDCWQERHFARSSIHDRTGILSYHAIVFLQYGQYDLGVIILLFCIHRNATTFKNEPQIKQSIMSNSKVILQLVFLF